MSGARTEHAFDGYAGCVQRRVSRDTGLLVGIYDAAQAGIDTDRENPWAVVCEPHGAIVCVATLATAKRSTWTPEWCDECREAHSRKI